MKWVEGRYRIEQFLIFVHDVRKAVQQARRLISDKKYKEILATIESTKNKTSADEEDKLVQHFDRAVEGLEKTY